MMFSWHELALVKSIRNSSGHEAGDSGARQEGHRRESASLCVG
jgi:hypothetical protein